MSERHKLLVNMSSDMLFWRANFLGGRGFFLEEMPHACGFKRVSAFYGKSKVHNPL
jgi:hypothetical protein